MFGRTYTAFLALYISCLSLSSQPVCRPGVSASLWYTWAEINDRTAQAHLTKHFLWPSLLLSPLWENVASPAELTAETGGFSCQQKKKSVFCVFVALQTREMEANQSYQSVHTHLRPSLWLISQDASFVLLCRGQKARSKRLRFPYVIPASSTFSSHWMWLHSSLLFVYSQTYFDFEILLF